jgi:ParB family transcriptional regulator, chromosome partitioning protein
MLPLQNQNQQLEGNTMSQNTSIPLNKLVAWEGNVRKTESDKGIDELAASISAHGLLQSLVVRKDKGGKFSVVAGRRRLLALQQLLKNKNLEAGHAVPCHVIDDAADSTEISLVENAQREAMHPADEFEAFKALIDGGMLPADVAARFGTTETLVKQRLKLAGVSPKLIALYRKGELSLQHVMAFTVTDDHKAQERVWKDLPDYQKRDWRTIRDTLTESEITADDRRVQFVTLKAYERAGGTTRRDLFSSGDDGVFILDHLLLASLITKKLEKLASEVQKEGWKWVEIRESFGHSEWVDHQRVLPQRKPLTAKEQGELKKLSTEYDELLAIDEPIKKQSERLDEISERVDELEDGEEIWEPETFSMAGAVVAIGGDGEPRIVRGLVKPEDQLSRKGKKKANGAAPAASGLPASLVETLTTHRSAAISASLCANPAVALATVVYAMFASDSVLKIRRDVTDYDRVSGSKVLATMEASSLKWLKMLPNEDALFAWCLKQKQERLLELLALGAAQSVNAIQSKGEQTDRDRLRHADELAEALDLDMVNWFTPTAENYFGRVTKAQIVSDLVEIGKGGLSDPAKASKRQAAELAESKAEDAGWLPKPLRKPK